MSAVRPMQEAAIQQYAKQLRLPTLGGQFARLAGEAVKEKQSHLSYLEALLEAEVEERDRKAMTRRIQEARFPSVKTLEEFDFATAPHISAALLRNLSEGGYLTRKVRFTTAAEMVTELMAPPKLAGVRAQWPGATSRSFDRETDRTFHKLRPRRECARRAPESVFGLSENRRLGLRSAIGPVKSGPVKLPHKRPNREMIGPPSGRIVDSAIGAYCRRYHPPLSRNLVLLDLLVERRAVDSQDRGGLLDVAAGAAQCRDDQQLLHFLHGHARAESPSAWRIPDLGEEGEILFRQHAAAAGHHGALHGVLQFAHVARPVVVHQHLEGAFGDLAASLAQLVRKPLHEVARQQRNVLAPLAQRRDADLDHVQPVKQVVAELAVGHRLLQIDVGGGDHPHVHLAPPRSRPRGRS